MNLNEYSDKQAQADALANQVAEQLNTEITEQDKASVALSGGSTPALFLAELSLREVAWEKLAVTLTDEREVPHDHERSNARFLQEHLLMNLPSKASYIPLDLGAYDNNLDAMEEALAADFPVTVCVLGMGGDGHFASIFPGANRLEEALDMDTAARVISMTVPDQEDRVTLSLPTILKSQHLHLLICGEDKLKVLNQANEKMLAGDWEFALPIQYLLQEAGDRLQVHYAA